MPRLFRLSAVVSILVLTALLLSVAPNISQRTVRRASAARSVNGGGSHASEPLLLYSTFIGGSDTDSANAVAVDAQGSAYVAGETASLNFPVTAGAKQTQRANGSDAFITKLTPDGSGAVYSTYAGGGGTDAAQAIAVDTSGNAYITGSTVSSNFPTTPGAFDTTCGSDGNCNASNSPVAYDAFVSKLNPQGSDFVYSTYLGGGGQEPVQPQVNWPDFQRMGIAIDGQGDAFVTGSTLSQDFPTTAGAYRTAPGSSFITKLNPAGAGLVYSTYFPGAAATAVAIDSSGDAYITGMAGDASSNPKELPVVNAYQPTIGGLFTFDAFAAKLNPAGSGLDFSTFLGGPEGLSTPRNGDDVAYSVGVDSAGNIYVAGTTRSGCFPSSNPYVPPDNSTCTFGLTRAFLAKLGPGGNTLLFSKWLPGFTVPTTPPGVGRPVLAVAPDGTSYIATSSGRVHKFSADGQLLFTATLDDASANGVAADAGGNIYVTGKAGADFRTTPGAFQTTSGGSSDAFVAKLSPNASEAQFASTSQNVEESAKKVTVSVDRQGDLASDFTVDYATSDETASERSDYTAAAGTLHFAPFEMSKTIDIFITDDAYGPEGGESFLVTLSNASGNASIGGKSSTRVLIADNDQAGSGPNPVAPESFNADFFLRQHYVDFLNREPDAPGFAFWSNQLTNCGNPNLEVCRINVSAAFFYSIEFQNSGYLVERTYKVSYGDKTSPGVADTVPIVTLNEFLSDTQKIGRGLIVGQSGWEALLEANKVAYFQEFVTRTRFTSGAPTSMTPAQFVDALFANAGVTPTTAERQAAIDEFGGAPNTADNNARARALRRVAENPTLNRQEFNRAFVLMQYFGYLRRNPDAAPDGNFQGWKFWLTKLEQFNGNFVQAEMVKAFISSDEYRHRFGP